MTCARCQALETELAMLRDQVATVSSLAVVFCRLAERRRVSVSVDRAPTRPAPSADIDGVDDVDDGQRRRRVPEREILRARDAAMLETLLARSDGATSRELLAGMPSEPNLSRDQRFGAYRATLARLEGRGLVRRDRDRFYLTSEGELVALKE